MRKLKHFLEYIGIRVLSIVARRLPLRGARWWGRMLGRFAFSLVRIRRNVTVANLKRAFPHLDTHASIHLARAVYEHFGMFLLEYLRMPRYAKRDYLAMFAQVENVHLLDAALQAGKGAILLTAHFGNWEYLGAWLGARGYPVLVMAQEQSNPYVSEFVRAARERVGMRVIPRGKALRRYLQTLREGNFVVMLADQDAGRSGVFLEFAGTPASTPTGPARFHLRTGAPLFLLMCYRDADANLQICVEQLEFESAGDNATTERRIMQAYNQGVGKWIERSPEQWLWMHKRWKTKPPEVRQPERRTAA